MDVRVPPEKPTVPRCLVCAQPAKKLKCVKCKTPYCSIACQTVDWKERGHKKECKRLVKANAVAAAEGASGDAAPTSLSLPKPKSAPPVVDGPARGRADIARARAAAAVATARTPPAPEPGHWLGTPRCPVCLDDWDVNAMPVGLPCCCKTVCLPCGKKLIFASLPCPLCRTLFPDTNEKHLAMHRRNVESGFPAAIGKFGNAYANGGYGLVPSHKKAARLYKRAADLGDVRAMFCLGCSYEQGTYVKLDKKKAIKFYRMAADRGHAKAQLALGNCYYNGVGAAQDYGEALRLYKMAAEQGLTNAEFAMGVMYTMGKGVAEDFAEAIRWYERAATKGHVVANSALAELRPKVDPGFGAR